MRKHYKRILKEQFRDALIRSRNAMRISQEEMAHRLWMATRTYVDLEHGKTCCGALTLVLYLIYICPDPAGFLLELRHALEKGQEAA